MFECGFRGWYGQCFKFGNVVQFYVNAEDIMGICQGYPKGFVIFILTNLGPTRYSGRLNINCDKTK
jgi:hypothetical protein